MVQGGCRTIPLQWSKLLIIVEYYSGLWEVKHLDSTVSSHMHVICKMKMQFARYDIPDVIMSDNGPQFFSEEYKYFSKMWKFT